jgi:hypothetical protein
MKLATIAPTQFLKEFCGLTNYQLVLAQEYVRDDVMASFYRIAALFGDTIILDNGAYELGESIPLVELAKIAEDLNPKWVMLPDARFDSVKTIHLVKEALKVFRDSPYNLMAIPQGRDLQDILNCYQRLSEFPEISGFGIYEEIGDVAKVGNRYHFCKLLEERKLVKKEYYYHMLGMEEDLVITRALTEFDWIGGIDSAKPVVYGLHHMDVENVNCYTAYPHRPKNYFNLDQIDEEAEHMIISNINKLANWLGGEENV